jgi:energy-coupling factor transport system substrate-specific component
MSETSTARHRPSTRDKIVWRWRVVDIVVAAVIGVAAGIVYWAWQFPAAGFAAVLPGVQSLGYGLWLLAGVLAALVIRKPGAALFAELVAAVVEALVGNSWGGPITILYGVVEGIGAELIFAVFLYANWRLWTAVLAGAVAGVGGGILDIVLYNPGVTAGYITVYLVGFAISGAVLAGVLGWVIVRALVASGVLSRFASGRQRTADV